MPLTFKQIRYFLAAVETGQISHAAMEMNVSQSAITAAIQSLEGDLGVRLLHRSARGVQPSIEGTRFLNHARNIVAAVEDAVRSPLGIGETVEGRLRVGTTYTVAGYFLPRHIARFRRAYPGIALDLREMSRDALEAAVVAGEVDLAVMLVSNLSDRARISHDTFFRSQRRLWMPVDHPLNAQARITLADVAREPYVMLTVDEAGDTAGRYWEKAGLRAEVVFSTSSVEAVRSFVASGMGVTVLSDMVYRPWSLEGQRIEVRALADPIPSMDVGLAWARGIPLLPAASVLRDFLSVATSGGPA